MFHHIIPSVLGNYELKRVDHEDGRYYLLNDQKYYSVTTILGATNPDEGWLERWRERVGEAEADRISKRAVTRGNNLHKACEDFVNNKLDYSKLDHFTKNRFKRLEPILRNRVSDVYAVEGKLYSNYLRAAGTADLIASFDKVPSIIDYKGSSRLKKAEDIENYFIQTSMYSIMFEERTGIPIPNCVIVIAVDDDLPQILKTEAKFWTKKAKRRVGKFYKQRSKKDAL